MIITGIEVSGIGRFLNPVKLTGLRPGVYVLAAANEAGKSTLFRAVRACLFDRHTATHRNIQDLASNGAALPAKVTVSFEHGGHEYVMAKSFVRSPAATLHRNGELYASGPSANDELWDVLGLKPVGGQVKDKAAFGLLWVGQRQSFDPGEISADASDTFGRLIAAEVGGLVGGERARNVLSRVQGELAQHVTDQRGDPRGPYKAAIEERDRLVREEAEARQRLTALDEDFGALARARTDVTRLADPTERGRLEEDVVKAQAALGEARKAADALARLALQAENAESRVAALFETCRSLDEANARIAASRERIDTLAQEISAFDADCAWAGLKATEALRAVTELEADIAKLARRTERLGRLDQASAAAERGREMASRYEEAARLAAEIEGLARDLATARATDKLVAEAAGLQERAMKLQARRDAAAPRLAILLGPEAGERVKLDGAVVLRDGSWALLNGATIAVDGIGTISVTPPESGASDALELSEVERRLHERLAEAGIESVLEGREELARLAGLRRDKEMLATRLGLLAPGEPSGDDGLRLLHERVAQASALVETTLTALNMAELPSPATLLAKREALVCDARLIETRKTGLKAALDAAQAKAQEAQARHGSRQALKADEEDRLRLALKSAPDESRNADLARLRKDLAMARDKHRQADAIAASQAASAPSADEVERRKSRVKRAAQVLANHDGERTRLEQAIFRLETGIIQAGGEGIEETLNGLVVARELADAGVRRLAEEVAALRLLQQTIGDCLAEGRERFLAPVKQHLAPFLNDLFPSAELQLGEDFKPVSLGREKAAETFGLLSDGTQEQIAVLVRLALGGMLATKGEPVPLILDDALVFSDDERIDRMFDALSRAAQSHQVIVLTCRTRTFRSLGGNVLRLEAA